MFAYIQPVAALSLANLVESRLVGPIGTALESLSPLNKDKWINRDRCWSRNWIT